MADKRVNPCNPSPCGQNSVCRTVNDQAVCICMPEFIGTPPNCRPECVINSECPLNRACVNQKCVDPCPNPCGANTDCKIVNHSPICACRAGFTGDPFTQCLLTPSKETISFLPSTILFYKLLLLKINNSFVAQVTPVVSQNPCFPSPCGPNSDCRDIGGLASCSCLPSYIGGPPNCRPECTINSDCLSSQACIRERCTDPCPGSCGISAQCSVLNHIPICVCPADFTGDPFIGCSPTPIERKKSRSKIPRLKGLFTN